MSSMNEDRYVDPVDIAARNTEQMMADALNAHKENSKYRLPYTGKCWFCSESVKKAALFCKPSKQDVADGYSCAAEYERLKDAQKRNGKK